MLILFILCVSVFAHCFGNYDQLPIIKGQHGLELEIVKPFLPENPTILEAGAHYGEDTVLFIQQWPHATVYAFEPCPSSYARLQQKTLNFSNIHIFPVALFSETGEYTFYMSEKYDGTSSLLPDNHTPYGVHYNDCPIKVLCKNLDEWAREQGVNHIDYMWLDMEGAELYMLRAAPEILQTVRALSCELNFYEYRKGMTQFADLHAFLTSNGFELYVMWGPPPKQSTGVYISKELLHT